VGPAAHRPSRPPPASRRSHPHAGLPDLRLQGRLGEARDALAGWLRAGTITTREHILEGPEATPGAIQMLYKGENTGKLVIAV